MVNVNLSPLRYPGGKARLADFLQDVILLNNLEGCTLFELYAGGAGASLAALKTGIVSKIVLNDLDYNIFSFWKSIINNTELFLKKISDTKIDIDEWNAQKSIFANPKQYSELEIGFSTFFLNRCNRSGILNAGPIGGKFQNGNYLVDARFNKADLMKRILAISRLREKIILSNVESLNIIRQMSENAGDKKFYFIDPPYFVQGSNLYFSNYSEDDHAELARQLKLQNSSNWILTYDNHEKIQSFYRGCKKHKIPMTYTLQEKRGASELLISSINTRLPITIAIGKKRYNLQNFESEDSHA